MCTHHARGSFKEAAAGLYLCLVQAGWLGFRVSHRTTRHQHTSQDHENMQKHRGLTVTRIDKFLDEGMWREVMLASALEEQRCPFDSEHVRLLVYSVPDGKRIPFSEAVKGKFRPTKVGETFGPSWVCNATAPV